MILTALTLLLPAFAGRAQDPAPAPETVAPQTTKPASGPVPEFEVIALAHADADEVAPTLTTLLGSKGKAMVDPRTNSLLLMASTKDMKRLRAVVSEIDQPVGQESTEGLFPDPSGDLKIAADPGSSSSMMDLVQEYARLTKQHFVIAPDTQTYLEQARTGLGSSLVVPKANVHSVFEELMILNDFVLVVRRTSEPRLLTIESLQSGARQTLRQSATLVPEEELQSYFEHPAILITTIVNLPNTDVRQLSNSMRTMITDANTQQMLPAGNTNSMVLTGFAANVAPLARMLKIVDSASAVESVDPLFRRFSLAHARAADVAEAIEELVNASSRRSVGGQAQGQGPIAVARRGHADARVMTDDRTNALVVMAMPYDMENIETLVALFDVKSE
ncbi:MAG: hypothetical protein GY711_07755 [bacterium]|nr:hypothetical protein [bacterium]